MKKVSQVSVKKKLGKRLSYYRDNLVMIAYRVGLDTTEIAEIFGTTKQNISLIINKVK